MRFEEFVGEISRQRAEGHINAVAPLDNDWAVASAYSPMHQPCVVLIFDEVGNVGIGMTPEQALSIAQLLIEKVGYLKQADPVFKNTPPKLRLVRAGPQSEEADAEI